VPHLADLFKAVLLGIIEGLTEFIPVSSTAHLLVSSYIIDFKIIKNSLFEIVIQLGAIIAICVTYRQKIFTVIFNLKQKSEQKFLLNLILAFLPAAIFGVFLHDFIKKFLFSNLVIAITLVGGGILMILVEKKFAAKLASQSQNQSPQNKNQTQTKNFQNKIPQNKIKINEIDNIKPVSAFYIGLFQCLAMIPGVSRSGATIIGGLLLNFDRKVAAEFSFFLAIPTIAAASFYDLLKNFSELNGANIFIILAGLLSAFFSAILVIKWFINFVSKRSFISFAIYRIIAGTLIFFYFVK
jgi:undecaprenyl-diphosphatase